MHFIPRLAAAAALLAGLSLPALAQERPNLMIVLDGSGSMWGQVDGRPKIELAREALSSVLSEVSAGMEIGLMVYGHRVRGQCSDIEMLVPMAPAAQSVPAILGAAGRLNPRGMTPLTESVMQAAQAMGFTEQAATVVLLTDGIETCAGDPCALGRMLAQQGIDFRAHVVGFDLSDDEQRQVSCLAQETGGLFLAAEDAAGLQSALAQMLAVEPAPMPEPEPEPEPAAVPRRVDLLLRDVAGGPVLTGRPFRSVELHPLDGGAPAGRIDLALNAPTERTARVDLLPGQYTLRLVRETQGRQTIRVALPIEIPAGEGPHAVDLVIAARLVVNALVHEGLPMPPERGRIPRLTGQGWAEFAIHPVIDGAIDAAVDYGGINSQDVALAPGDYLIRGTLTQTFTRERLVSVAPGVTTTVDFDFGAAPVSVDLRDAQGFAVDRVRVEIFDLDATEPFVSGRGRDRTEIVPAFLPQGNWRITAREDRGGALLAEAFVTVTPGQPVSLSLTPGQPGDPSRIPETATAQCLDTHAALGCVVQAVTPLDMVRHLGLNGRAAGEQVAPRFTGTWQTDGGWMALVQEGRRVWGEVHVNGGIGRVWGHVAPDGLTLRGAMDRSSNPRGAVEMRLSPDAATLLGFWDHSIGQMRSTLRARRLSGGVPPLVVATGTDDDLRLGMNGAPWAPADSPEFAAFLEPALAPASPDTGEDIDAMQQASGPSNFTGVWNTNHQQLRLVQEGRRVNGRRDRGPIWGQVSADGQTMRGIWINSPREWGFLEFRLDDLRMGFEGSWGSSRDGGTAAANRWTGSRRGWLVAPQEAVALPEGASGEGFDSFLAPVRDPDPVTDRAELTPPIGAMSPLPERGIFVAMADRPGEALDAAFARLFDPLDTAQADAFADTCWQQPWVLHPDGLMAERQIDTASGRAGGPGYRTVQHQICEQSGPLAFCRVFLRPLSPTPGDPDFDYRAEVIAGPEGSFALRESDTGRAILYRSCEGPLGFLNAEDRWDDGRLLTETMVEREDQGAPARPEAPGTPARSGSLPPGLWHTEAPWSDPMPARGTPAFADRCLDTVNAIWSDGLSVGMEWQQGAQGPIFGPTWAETCLPTGDADWPHACEAQDWDVTDDIGIDPVVTRMRIEGATAERVDLLLLTPGEPAPERFVLHACHGPGGVDLQSDPRARALVSALFDLRPGLPLPLGDVPAPATPGDPRADLAGTWFVARDGRALAEWTPDETAQACFEGPARFHPDGLFRLFQMREGVLQADSFMTCGPDLSCTYTRGAPSEGRRSEGQAALGIVSATELSACLGTQCITLGRCPAPDWSARERASGLAAEWEAAVEARD